jgi:hypothetical protein
MVADACLAAMTTGVPDVTMTSTLSRTIAFQTEVAKNIYYCFKY